MEDSSSPSCSFSLHDGFGKKFDQPSEAALEWQKEQEEKRKERKVWESVEMQMRREAEEAEQRAAFQLKREIAASSGTPPDAAVVAKAFASLGGAPEPIVKTEAKVEEEVDNSDLENVPDLVKVRQDVWDESADNDERQEEPDLELVERLKRMAESGNMDEIPYPELPHAPSLPDIEPE